MPKLLTGKDLSLVGRPVVSLVGLSGHPTPKTTDQSECGGLNFTQFQCSPLCTDAHLVRIVPHQVGHVK